MYSLPTQAERVSLVNNLKWGEAWHVLCCPSNRRERIVVSEIVATIFYDQT